MWNIGLLSIIVAAICFLISMLMVNVFESELWKYFLAIAIIGLLITGIVIIWIGVKKYK